MIKKLLVRNMNEGLRLVKDAYGPDALILKSMKRNGKIELFVEVPNELTDEDPRESSSPNLQKGLQKGLQNSPQASPDPSLDGLELERLLAADAQQSMPDAELRSPSDDIRTEYQNAKYRMLNAIGDATPLDIAPAADKAPAAGKAPAAPSNEGSAAYQYQEPETAKMGFSAGDPSLQSRSTKGSFDAILGSVNNSSRGYERTVVSMIEGLQLDTEVAGRVRDCRRVDELTEALVKLIRTDEQPGSGIRAFVGPSGSGKTTSLIKLITRRVLQFGANSCAIINCDRYRAGASQQLDRMGELMDVEVIHLRPGLELASAINRVKHREFVAIDMPGLSMADNNLAAELQRLENTRFDIQRYLVLPANLQANVMHRAADTYGEAGKTSCIFTRLDETDSLGAALSFLIRRRLNLAFTAHGTHIPEDIQTARSIEVVQEAIRLMDQSLYGHITHPNYLRHENSMQSSNNMASEFAKAPISDFNYRTTKSTSKMVADV